MHKELFIWSESKRFFFLSSLGLGLPYFSLLIIIIIIHHHHLLMHMFFFHMRRFSYRRDHLKRRSHVTGRTRGRQRKTRRGMEERGPWSGARRRRGGNARKAARDLTQKSNFPIKSRPITTPSSRKWPEGKSLALGVKCCLQSTSPNQPSVLRVSLCPLNHHLPRPQLYCSKPWGSRGIPIVAHLPAATEGSISFARLTIVVVVVVVVVFFAVVCFLCMYFFIDDCVYLRGSVC